MSEANPKKTVLVWQPPAAATQPGMGANELALGATEQAPVPAAPDLAMAVTGTVPKAATADAPRRDTAAPLGPGDVIGGRYVVRQLVGQGGFAAVYRAADDQIPNHEVAIKLLNAPAPSLQARAVGLRELTLIASVSHPSVVQFKDYGWHEDRLFFAMPWYRGKTLTSAAPLDRADARRVFERSAYGLQAMHDAGIFHYDIKPDNIFLADIEGFEAGFPVLLDLGIAAKRGEKPTALTPDYASPETARSILDGGSTPVGSAADVFALALSLRNVLEPETAPEVQESLPAFLLRRSTEPVSPPTRKDLRDLKPLFARWLSLEPSERPTAAEFAVELAALTAPQERRAARRHMLLRMAPIVLALGLVATVLALRLKTTTSELVGQRLAGEKQSQEANQRLAQLRAQSEDQLDAKLQLALDFQSQRDQLKLERDKARATLDTTSTELGRTRTELRTRTRERDQTRSELATQSAALQQATAALDQKTREAADRTRELASARAEVQTRSAELAQRAAERDRARGEVAKLERTVRDQEQALAKQKTTLAAQGEELATNKVQLKKARTDLAARDVELARGRKDLDKSTADRERLTKQRDAARAEVESLTRDLKRATLALLQARKAGAAKAPAAAPAP